MESPKVSNPKDHQVVTFVNATDFVFTPEMGAMYDSRPVFGVSGNTGIAPGESVVLPYHIGILIAQNLAKYVMTQNAPKDAKGVPTGVPLWDEASLLRLRDSYLTDLYVEETAVEMSDTDKLMAKVEEYKKMVDKVIPKEEKDEEAPKKVATKKATKKVAKAVYVDKADVIAELKKRGIKYNARLSKANLEKLLV